MGAVLISAAVFMSYFPSLGGGFIWDDESLIVRNPLIKASDGLYRIWCSSEAFDYWPIINTTFWIEWRMWGMHPTGYHIANLLLHIAASLLIWIILRRLSIPGAFLAALVFAVHPVNVESVAWIAQRKNTLAMLFFLLSILWYMKADMLTASVGMAPAADMHTFSSFILHPSSFLFWYWLSLLSFVMAMLSKGSVAVLPVILLMLIWWRRKVTIKDLARTVPFFMVGAVLVVVNVWFQTHGQEADVRTAVFAERLLGAGAVVWFYLYKAILPLNLAFVYPEWCIQTSDLLWWLPLLAVLIVTAALWRYRNGWSRPFVFVWGIFCVTLMPVMGFTDVYFMKFALVADHYQYISIIGLIALAAASWSCWHRQTRAQHRWMTGSAAGIAVCMLMFLTWNQSGLYRDTVTLYSATLKINPRCWMAHNNLGVAFFDEGKLAQAMEHFQQALNLKPEYAEPCNNLGECLLKAGRLPEAIDYFKHALRIKPGYDLAYWNLVMSYVKSNRPDEAVAAARKALDVARLQGQADLAKKIEIWLNSYRPGLSPPKNVSP
jgi:hypothetical protein